MGFGVFEVRGFGLGVGGSGFLRFGVSGVSGSGYRVRRFTFLGFLFGVLRFEVRAWGFGFSRFGVFGVS